MPDSLNFSNVSSVSAPKGDADLAARLIAILRYHEGVKRDENGKGVITLRQLAAEYAPQCPPLLLEYFCGFGAYGKTVLERYFEYNNVDAEKAAELADGYYTQIAKAAPERNLAHK